jgi:lysophospholipase
MEEWPNGEFVMIQNAKHDVLTETPEIGGDVMDQIVELFSRIKAV